MNKTKVYEKTVTIPTYPVGKPEPAPLFIEKRAYQGSSGKVYPLPVTEKIGDSKEDRQYRAIVLENDYLYVEILPELGGRIERALDKTNGYDFVYYNHVIKPALVGLAGPWISGGIEFNWPQHHRPSTFMPVDCSYTENEDGSATVTVGETDRINGTKGNAAITLYPDRAYIEIRGRLFNPTDFPQSFLWWANPAVPVNDKTFSVFPPDVNAVMDHGKRAVSTFPIATGEYYKVDYSEGVDISRYKNIKVPTSYMAAHSDYDFVGNYDEGRCAGLLHVADHHVSPGKKQWTWGSGDFGKTWDKNLTDEDGPYIELMTGVYCDNQPDFTWLKPQEEKTFVQYFMPYKTVGRVSNATKDIVIGVDEDTIRIYASGDFNDAHIKVFSQDKEIYNKQVNLSPLEAFVDTVQGLCDYRVSVCDCNNRLLCEYKEYKRKNRPIPEPASALQSPDKLGTTEELLLAGQHLEQYRHATFLPADYYLEGLRRDPTDIRLNNAYGLYLLKNAQIKASIPYFEAAVKKQTLRNPNPYSGEAYYNLGVAGELVGHWDAAYDNFYKATWSAETAGAAFFHMACICVKNHKLDAAEEFALESLYRGYHDMKTRTLLCGIYAHEDKDCRKFAEESYAIDPLYFGVLYRLMDTEAFATAMGGRLENFLNLALEYIESGFYDDAIAVLKLCPTDSPMKHYYAAFAYGRLQRADEATCEISKGEAACPDYCFPSKVSERVILEYVIATSSDAPMAHYYLAELLYDKRQYAEAIMHWENSAARKPEFALTHRNLSIAYYNHGDQGKAYAEIAKACELEPGNSRFLLEQDQLLNRLGAPHTQRLQILEAHRDILGDRYALELAYVSLLNEDGQYERALEIMKRYTFHVWEGGEGKVAEEYKKALFGLADMAMARGDEKSLRYAIKCAESSLSYPDNLGEGKLENVPDNHAYYIMGSAYKKLGDEAEACRCFKLATRGSQIPEPVRYYNDQPSDYIYYQGLAYHEIGDDKSALKSFHQLIIFGERHIFDKVGYDFFAVSMPELEVYQDDPKKRSDDYCRKLEYLGRKGLTEIGERSVIGA